MQHTTSACKEASQRAPALGLLKPKAGGVMQHTTSACKKASQKAPASDLLKSQAGDDKQHAIGACEKASANAVGASRTCVKRKPKKQRVADISAYEEASVWTPRVSWKAAIHEIEIALKAEIVRQKNHLISQYGHVSNAHLARCLAEENKAWQVIKTRLRHEQGFV